MNRSSDLEEKALQAVRSLARSKGNRNEFAKAYDAFVDATAQLPIVGIDDLERKIRYEMHQSSRTKKHIRFPYIHKEKETQIHWLDVLSGDGFKREKALKSINGPVPNAFLYAIILRRLNDWVNQVRETASGVALNLGAATHPSIVVDALWGVLPNIESWGRIHKSNISALFDILTLAGVTDTFVGKIIHSTSGPAARLLRQSSRLKQIDTHLETIARSAVQPSARATAYKFLLEGKVVWLEGRRWAWTDKIYCKGRFEPILCERRLSIVAPFNQLLAEAASDRSATVRKVAGDAIIANRLTLGPDAIKIVKKLAADSYPSIAGRGQFVLERL